MTAEPTTRRPRPRPRLRKIVIDLGIMTVLGVLLALIGPFGSFADPLPWRLMSWLLLAYVGYAIYSPMSFFVDRAEAALDLPRIWLWVAAVAIATVPMTTLVWSLNFVPGPVALPRLDQAMTLYFYVFIIGGGVTALFYTLESRGAQSSPPAQEAESQAAEPAPPPQAPTNPLLDQLPPALGSEVIALEMEDHYVRVHTALGSELVLMRLRDAIAHMTDVEGRQVHRSWWVARGAVEDVRREGRNVRLVLSDTLEAPVSRAQVSELKEAGWI